MSTGFEFRKKREVVICGKAYPCDFSDSRMLEGVSRDFPRILRTAEEFSRLYAQMLEGVAAGEKSEDYVKKVLQKNRDLVCVCREFIEGTIGPDEYREIFADRMENSSEHIDLCAYIYSEIMVGRQEMLDQYLANRAKEGETLEHAADSKSDAEAAGHDSQSESPDGLAVVAEKRGLRAWLATALAGKA